jgi:uncharacterized protein YlxW (UPF0749 family)
MNISTVVERLRTQSVASLGIAREYLKIPLPPEFTKNRHELTNKRILSSLKKLGVATQAEVKLLQSRIEKLEEEIKALRR